MGPFHRLISFSVSAVDVNNNKMGVKGKNKPKVTSDVDIFGAEKQRGKTYWPTLKTSKKNKGI